MNFIIKRYANNEIRLIRQTPAYRRKNQGDKSRERHLTQAGKLFEELRIVNGLLRSTDSFLIPVVDIRPDGRIVEEFLCRSDLEKRRQALLDITKKSQHRSLKHAAWGIRHPKKNFGAKARHKILEAGAVIDQIIGSQNAYEITVTIPGSTPAAINVVADWSGWITNRMTQVIRRSKIANEVMWFFVWELQKRGALHMHWCIAHPDLKEVKNLAHALEYEWFELLLELQSKCGIDCFAKKEGGTHRDSSKSWQSNVQQIRKSVAAYYAKYAGKEAKNNKRLNRWKARDLHYPARWWGSNQNVKDAIKEESWEVRYEGLTWEQCEEAERSFWELADTKELVCKYEYEFCLTHPALSMPLCSGKVKVTYWKPETWQEFSAGLKELFDAKTNTGLAAIPDASVMSLIVGHIKQEGDKKLENIEYKEYPQEPQYICPFTGQVFLLGRDLKMEAARIDVANYNRAMAEYDYQQRIDELQWLVYQAGFADCDNPYLITEKNMDLMIEYANERMDYLRWLEAANAYLEG